MRKHKPKAKRARAAAPEPPPLDEPEEPEPHPEALPAPEEEDEARALKRLLRRLARVLHPDLAQDDAERARLHALMSEVNAAYERGEINVLINAMLLAEGWNAAG